MLITIINVLVLVSALTMVVALLSMYQLMKRGAFRLFALAGLFAVTANTIRLLGAGSELMARGLVLAFWIIMAWGSLALYREMHGVLRPK